MSKWISVFLLCSALHAISVQEAEKRIDSIVAAFDPNVHIGIEVVDLKSKKTLLEKNKDHLFVPASCLKLFTAAAALELLGADFTYETKLLSSGKIKGKILKGDLFIKGAGDPELQAEDLRELAAQLKRLGIEKIEGDLCVDDMFFDGVAQGPGWMWDDVGERWNVPIGALCLDHNCVGLWITPGRKAGSVAKVEMIPAHYEAVEDLAASVARCEKAGVSEPSYFSIAVANPARYAATILLDILREEGIAVKGKVVMKAVPEPAAVLATHRSRPLTSLVEIVLKSSDNLYADCLFKTLGAHQGGAPGTWQKGAEAVREFLSKKARIDVERMVALDGSGATRYNLVSPHQLAAFLVWTQDKRCFVDALPIAGVDGTLQERMVDLKGRVRAKTGSMTGVSTLSGYVGTRLAFSICLNGFKGKLEEYRAQIEDPICACLAELD